jgi:hypothetical protein
MGEEGKRSNGTKQVARASVSQRQLCVSLPVANFQKHHQSDPIVPTSEPRLDYPATRHNSATSTSKSFYNDCVCCSHGRGSFSRRHMTLCFLCALNIMQLV